MSRSTSIAYECQLKAVRAVSAAEAFNQAWNEGSDVPEMLCVTLDGRWARYLKCEVRSIERYWFDLARLVEVSPFRCKSAFRRFEHAVRVTLWSRKESAFSPPFLIAIDRARAQSSLAFVHTPSRRVLSD